MEPECAVCGCYFHAGDWPVCTGCLRDGYRPNGRGGYLRPGEGEWDDFDPDAYRADEAYDTHEK